MAPGPPARPPAPAPAPPPLSPHPPARPLTHPPTPPTHISKDRVYYMFAPDEVMQDRWVARINEVIALVRRAPRRGKQPEKDEEGGGAV